MVSTVMSSNFLKVEAYQRIEQVSRLVTSRAQLNAEHDFAIESGGNFLGIGTVIDLLRKEKRHTSASQLEDGPNLSGDALIEHLFEENGHWQKDERPKKWDQPDHGVENAHFWKVFDACLNALPAKYGRLFMMREFLEMDTSEICHNEDVSVSSLNVTLYRARLRLRECLEDHWFQKETAT